VSSQLNTATFAQFRGDLTIGYMKLQLQTKHNLPYSKQVRSEPRACCVLRAASASVLWRCSCSSAGFVLLSQEFSLEGKRVMDDPMSLNDYHSDAKTTANVKVLAPSLSR
jgi:hypothetical protein